MFKKITAVLVLVFIFAAIPSNAFANWPYPLMLNLKLKNISEGAYVDILLPESWTDGFDAENLEVTSKYNINSETSPLYNYNEDEYLAVNVRDSWIESFTLTKKSLKVYFFECPPQGFKVIVQTSDETIQVSEYSDFDAYHNKYTYDYKTNSITKSPLNTETFDAMLFYLGAILLYLVVTIIIELITASFFKIPKKPVIWINAITNPILNILLIFVYPFLAAVIPYYIIIIAFELVIILIEFYIYSEVTTIKNKKLLLFSATANLASALVPYLILTLIF